MLDQNTNDYILQNFQSSHLFHTISILEHICINIEKTMIRHCLYLLKDQYIYDFDAQILDFKYSIFLSFEYCQLSRLHIQLMAYNLNTFLLIVILTKNIFNWRQRMQTNSFQGEGRSYKVTKSIKIDKQFFFCSSRVDD